MEIRRATDSDLPTVQNCAFEAYSPYVADIGREPAPMIQDFALAAEQSRLWVTDPFVGYIVFYGRGDTMFIENVAVPPKLQGRGHGRTLIKFAEAIAREHNLNKVELYTNSKMEENQKFYPKLGYIEFDFRSEDGFERIYYRKTL